jgi:hypothetical protein
MSNSHFKFALLLNNKVITERIFPKHFINNINLQDVAKTYIRQFKQTLSTPDKDLRIAGDIKNYQGYKSGIPTNVTNKKTNELINYIKAAEFAKLPDSENKTVRLSTGGKSDEGFYINDQEKFKYVLYNEGTDEKGNPTKDIVIERNFMVENYNPNVRFSYNLTDTFSDIVTDIQSQLKKRDFEILHKNYERHPFSSFLVVE